MEHLLRTTEKILNEQYAFYQDLYRKDDTVHFQQENSYGIQLNEAQKSRTDQPFSEAEVKSAIFDLKKKQNTRFRWLKCGVLL